MNEKQNLLVSYAHDIKERKGDKKDILIQFPLPYIVFNH